MIDHLHVHVHASTQAEKASQVVSATIESNDDLEAKVALIVSTLGTSYRDFGLASETYNSIFFRDEDPNFVRELALGLINHYPMWPNTCWNKVVSQVQVNV